MSGDLRYNFELLERCDAHARRASQSVSSFKLPWLRSSGEWTTIASCSQARSLSPTHAAIIAKYLIIFKPLMESFSTGRRARLCRGSAQSRDATEVLEALRQCHIPGSPPDIGLPLVVAIKVGNSRSDKWRILVEHIVHAKRNGGIIEPGTPTR